VVTPRSQRGQGLVELALIAPILLMILPVVIDFGRGLLLATEMGTGAREMARPALVMDAGLCYVSGYSQPSDGDPSGAGTDAACAAILVSAPSGPPGTPLPAIDGTYFDKGSNASAYKYGAVFWPGAHPGSPGCQWTANGTSQIVGALVCLTLQQQGGAVKLTE
jgi:hypothetical protein